MSREATPLAKLSTENRSHSQSNQKLGTTDPRSREHSSAHEELDLDRVVNYQLRALIAEPKKQSLESPRALAVLLSLRHKVLLLFNHKPILNFQ